MLLSVALLELRLTRFRVPLLLHSAFSSSLAGWQQLLEVMFLCCGVY